MHLPNRLSAATLGDLLGTLHRSHITGLLELTEIGPSGGPMTSQLHRIHLQAGLVSAVDTSFPIAPIGEILRREGFIDMAAVRTLLRRLAAGDVRPAGEILVALGAASEGLVQAALRAQLRLRLEAVFRLDDALIAFRPARPSPRQSPCILPLSPRDFLHGRPRARDAAGPCSHVRHKVPAARAAKGTHSPPPSSPIDPARRAALETLGLPLHVGEAEIRRAFRRLAVDLHPDRHAGAPCATQHRKAARFAKLSAAYHLLVA